MYIYTTQPELIEKKNPETLLAHLITQGNLLYVCADVCIVRVVYYMQMKVCLQPVSDPGLTLGLMSSQRYIGLGGHSGLQTH